MFVGFFYFMLFCCIEEKKFSSIFKLKDVEVKRTSSTVYLCPFRFWKPTKDITGQK